MEELYLVKIGGGVINQPELLDPFLEDFAAIPQKKILVHGGGRLATDLADQLEIPVQMIQGRRITDREMLKIVVMVYGGYVNKTVVASLQGHGCNAIGLTGADANIIPAHKRIVKDIDYGFVGDFDQINRQPLLEMLGNGLTPVLAPLTHDSQGNMLNTNADTIAASVARELVNDFRVHLVLCFEKPGVLMKPEDDSTVIPKLTLELYGDLKKSGEISSGMIPKLDTGFAARQSGVAEVRICHANALQEAASGEPVGTTLEIERE
ncbi:MAG: acetylglutamate kinase [Candidatus Marinimicrobia bacterium]|nr:acetylglutamate kinase [Candidatus Neomarinimicrobiota bacterium]